MGDRISGEAPWRRSRIVVPVASPAAGSDWSLTVPAGHVYRILSAYAQLATSATVATRSARLTVSDGVAVYLLVPPIATQAASATNTYTWFPHAGAVNVANAQAVPIPELVLPAGSVLAVSTASIQAADAWTGVYVDVLDTTVRDGDLDVSALPTVVVEVVGQAA